MKGVGFGSGACGLATLGFWQAFEGVPWWSVRNPLR